MRRFKFVCLFCVVCLITVWGQNQSDFHLKTAEPVKSTQSYRSASSGNQVRSINMDEIEQAVSSKITEVTDGVLDILADFDWSAFLEKLLPEKFKEILADAGLWPIEGSTIDIDMKEMTDMGKEVMENISSLGD